MISSKKLKIPKITNKFNIKLLKELKIKISKKNINHKSSEKLIIRNESYDPVFKELFFLHNLVTLNKRLTILEFGSGWSSLFLSHALRQNKKKYARETKKIRGKNKFEIFVLENEKKYLEISKNRVKRVLTKDFKIHWCFSQVKMSEFQGRYCTVYKKLPKVNPDFIYLDGPDQFKIKGKINNFNLNHEDFMPMVSDLLKIEFFLKPGTILVVDGRSANVQFLRSFFKRKWLYYYVKEIDKHVLYLDSKSLGLANDKLLNFYER